jgi:thiol-disulfide isomerase/thioredoxin
MRKVFDALVDFLSGVPLLLILFLDGRVLLQTRTLVYFAFPLLCTVAFAIGFWRGRRSSLPLIATAALASTPALILALYFFSGRNKPFIIFPVVAFVFILIGGIVSRPRTAIAVLVVANIAVAFAGPPFIGLIVHNRLVKEKPIPYTIHLIDGRTISSQELRGRVVVLDFWATWCVPCQRELPALQRAYEKTSGRNDVAFFAVDGVMSDSGTDGDTAERAREYYRRGGYTLPLAFDGGALLEKSFSLSCFPTLLVLDPAGQVRMRHVGFIGSEDLEGVLLRTIDDLTPR